MKRGGQRLSCQDTGLIPVLAQCIKDQQTNSNNTHTHTHTHTQKPNNRAIREGLLLRGYMIRDGGNRGAGMWRRASYKEGKGPGQGDGDWSWGNEGPWWERMSTESWRQNHTGPGGTLNLLEIWEAPWLPNCGRHTGKNRLQEERMEAGRAAGRLLG